MTYVDGILFVAAICGLVAGGILVARSPTFWVGLGIAIFNRLKPQLIAWFAPLFKRMPPEKEKEWRDCIRRGGEWDHVRKRCKR